MGKRVLTKPVKFVRIFPMFHQPEIDTNETKLNRIKPEPTN